MACQCGPSTSDRVKVNKIKTFATEEVFDIVVNAASHDSDLESVNSFGWWLRETAIFLDFSFKP